MPYKYYDTPDGEDCFKKLWLSTKYATMLGLVYSSYDVILYSHPKGYFQTAARYVYITAPLLGMASTFTVTTCALTSLRKKDDHMNYFLAGCASGSIFGVWRKSGPQGLAAALIFGMAACFLKSAVVNNWDVFPKMRRAYGGVDSYLNDWTLTKERPRNWRVSLDEDVSSKN